MEKRLGWFLVVLIFSLFIASYPTWGLDLSERFFWYDMVLHFGGGAWVAGMVFLYRPHTNPRLLLAWTLLIGVGWEIFEIIVSIYTNADWYSYRDGASDLIFDILGACAFVVVTRYLRTG